MVGTASLSTSQGRCRLTVKLFVTTNLNSFVVPAPYPLRLGMEVSLSCKRILSRRGLGRRYYAIKVANRDVQVIVLPPPFGK